jgi:hypothetical protein
MNKRKAILAVVATALVAMTVPAARAANDAAKEAWAKAMAPGKPHASLAEEAGDWRYTVTMWEAPGAQPTTLKGVSTKKMVMGGRFLEEELTGEYKEQPFHGHGITGFDNVTQEYQSIWLDNMGTGLQWYTGRDDANGTRTYTSTMRDPVTGRAASMRSVARTIDKDHHTYESYVTLPDGKEMLQMRVEYTRADR